METDLGESEDEDKDKRGRNRWFQGRKIAVYKDLKSYFQVSEVRYYCNYTVPQPKGK